jgi:hypothetical protein
MKSLYFLRKRFDKPCHKAGILEIVHKKEDVEEVPGFKSFPYGNAKNRCNLSTFRPVFFALKEGWIKEYPVTVFGTAVNHSLYRQLINL